MNALPKIIEPVAAFATPHELTALRLQLRANGYHPVPVIGPHVNTASAGKRPRMKEWETRCFNADPQEIERWSRVDRNCTNTGLLCGEMVAVDVDVLDPNLSADLLQRAETQLGHSPLRRIGRAPKTLLCYRVSEPFKKLQTPDLLFDDGTKGKIEVLAEGQQYVAFGIHPDTRAPYCWPDASPVDVPFADLPIVTRDVLAAYVEEAAELLRSAGGATIRERQQRVKAVATNERQSAKRERKGRLLAALHDNEKPNRDMVAAALDHLPNDLDYDTWVKIGFAIYEGLGDAGKDLWERWSAKSSKNDPAFTARKWPSFAQGRSVTVGTLFWFAAQNGWRRSTVRSRATEEAGGSAGIDASQNIDRRPRIRVVGGNLPSTVTAAERALIAANMGLYQRGSLIVRPAVSRVAIADGRKTMAVRLVPVRSHHIAELMTRAADWERFDMRSEEWVPIDCPQRVADTYLAREGQWHVPVLSGIVNCPVLRPDGSVLDTPGYDDATGLLFDAQDVKFDPIPDQPSKGDAGLALDALRDLVATFPFVTPADRAVALSAILTAVHRRSLPTAPLHAFSAPVAGSGKSMLVDIASEITDGRSAAVMSLGRTEDEAEKRLGAALIAGDAIVSIDNVERPFGGELFCQALTQATLKVRILGLSKLAEVPSNAAMFATGNNLTLVGDMTRRAVLCSLDPGVERPELRQFGRAPLDMIRADRDRYVNAALTVLRAFHVAGRPQQVSPLGSFEEWSRWIRDALLWLGEADPCETMEKARTSDPKLEALTAVISQWEEVIGEDRVSGKNVIDRAIERLETVDPDNYYARSRSQVFKHPEFREALLAVAGDGGNISTKRLGRWLGANQNRLVNGLKLISDGMIDGIARWRLVAASPVVRPAMGVEVDNRPRF